MEGTIGNYYAAVSLFIQCQKEEAEANEKAINDAKNR